MKKRRTRISRAQMLMIGSVLLLMVGFVTRKNVFRLEATPVEGKVKQQVFPRAEPKIAMGEVTIDADEMLAPKLKIPKDSTTLSEPSLISDLSGKYAGFVQASGYQTDYFKDKLFSYGHTVLNETYLHVVKVPSGFIALYQVEGNMPSLGGENGVAWFSNLGLVKMDDEGIIKEFKWIGHPEAPYWGAANKPMDQSKRTIVLNPQILDTGGSTYTVIYNTYNGLVYRTNFDENLTIKTDKVNTNIASTDWRRAIMRSVNGLDNIMYASTNHSGDLYFSAESDAKVYHGFKYNANATELVQKLTLKLPDIKSINNGFANHYTSGITYRYLSRTDTGYIGTGSIDAPGPGPKYILTLWDHGGSIIKNHVGSFAIIRDLSQLNSPVFFMTNLKEINNGEAATPGIVKINTSTGAATILKRYPVGTSIHLKNMKSDPDKIQFYGNITNFTGEFEGLNTTPGFVLGTMDKSTLDVVDISPMGIPNLVIGDFIPLKDNIFLYGGITGRIPELIIQSTDFLAGTNAFSGFLKYVDNYGPAIKLEEDILIELKESDSEIEKQLLKGIDVFDTYDLSDKNMGVMKTLDWLKKRVNVNYNSLTYKSDELTIEQQTPKDWLALNFDKKVTGPQQIKYFVADANRRITASSRWINKKTPQTVIKDDYAIDAQNFTLPLTDVGTLVDSLAKTKAKSMAWNLKTHVIDEDTSKNPAVLSNKVTINQAQLEAIKKTTVAKPFPLTFTYQTAGGPIVNKIWVFVTDKNTTVDEEKELVMYGLDYSVAQDIAKDHTNTLAINKDHGATRVYDLTDAINKGVAVTDLPPIAGVQADGTVLGANQLIADSAQLEAIKKATVQQGKDDTRFPLRVTYDGGISVELTVTVVARQAELTIKFQDADGETVHFEANGTTPKADLTSTEIIGDKLLASTIKGRPEVTAAINKILTEGYTSLNNYNPTEEVEILKTGTTYIFKFNGAVELTNVTNNMTFETGVVWIRGQTLNYESTEDFLLTIRDTRQAKGATEAEKLRGKFSVNAKLNTNFIHTTQTNSILKDAQIVYFDGTKDVILSLDSGAQEVVKRTGSSATKQINIMLDDKDAAKKNLRLEVPDSNILEGTYKADIVWDLIQGP